MRRRLLTIAIFLLAGAVVNVAVAWGIALRHGSDAESSSAFSLPAPIEPAADEELEWLFRRGWRTGPVSGHVRTTERRAIGFRQVAYVEWPKLSELSSRMRLKRPFVFVTVTGWPLGSFGDSSWRDRASDGINLWMHSNGLQVPEMLGLFPAKFGYTLPRGPVWTGIAMNTLFYAVLL